jgi:hypothetical protein
MPKPVYIICSVSTSEDKRTGLLSHFQVYEQIQILDLPTPKQGEPVIVPAMPLHVSVVWAMSDDDRPGDELEISHSFFLPPNEKEVQLPSGTVFFEEGKPFIRFIGTAHSLVLTEPGVFRVESRIRRVGQADWLRQSYEIPVIRPPASKTPEVQLGEAGEKGSHLEESVM